MVVRKILEGILASCSTSISFTDTELPNSLIRVYSTDPDLMPVEQSLSGNTLTITYEPQGTSKGVAVEMVKQGLDIVDNLLTDDSTKALSANQGYVLKGLIDDIVIPTVPENITDLDDVSVSSIQNGQVLAWNSTSEKFENVNQSGGGSAINYSTNEQVIGTWIDGSILYQKTIEVVNPSYGTSWSTIPFSDVGLSDMKECVYIEGVLVSSLDAVYNIQAYRPQYNIGIVCSVDFNVESIDYINSWINDVSGAHMYITIRYTKTTD